MGFGLPATPNHETTNSPQQDKQTTRWGTPQKRNTYYFELVVLACQTGEDASCLIKKADTHTRQIAWATREFDLFGEETRQTQSRGGEPIGTWHKPTAVARYLNQRETLIPPQLYPKRGQQVYKMFSIRKLPPSWWRRLEGCCSVSKGCS